jgi:PhnB protein
VLHPERYVFATTGTSHDGLHPVVTVLEDEGVTLVLEQGEADRHGLGYQYVAAMITLRVRSALDEVGLTAAVATALTEHGISCNVVAGHFHDHLFVPPDRGEEAVDVLTSLTPERAGRLPPVAAVAQLSVRRGRDAVEFYRAAFGAVEVYRVGGTDEMPDVVSQLVVGGATFWVSDEAPEHGNHSPESLGGATVRMLLVVEDPEAVIARAVDLGARQVHPAEPGHGWLLGRIEDPFGHHWEIGRPLVDWPPPH